MAQTQLHQISSILQGQKVQLPDLAKLSQQWDTIVNPNEDQVKAVVDRILSMYTVSPRVNAKLTQNMLSTYVSSCFPFAERETLTELTYFVCWMFLVDDEIDQLPSENDAQGSSLGQLWSEVLGTAQKSCSVVESGIRGEANTLKPTDVFWDFGKGLRHKYSIDQCSRFLNEIATTAGAYQMEQKYRDEGILPNYSSYCDYRYGRCCMAQVVALVE
ncbi:hypothetical protein Neosp_015255 [[Neocosmospora] mangrovei]